MGFSPLRISALERRPALRFMASSFMLYALAFSMGEMFSRFMLASTMEMVASSRSSWRTMTGMVWMPASWHAR